MYNRLIFESTNLIHCDRIRPTILLKSFKARYALIYALVFLSLLLLCPPTGEHLPSSGENTPDVTFCLFQFLAHNLLERFSLIRLRRSEGLLRRMPTAENGEAKRVKNSTSNFHLRASNFFKKKQGAKTPCLQSLPLHITLLWKGWGRHL